jgi:hypothetical protein
VLAALTKQTKLICIMTTRNFFLVLAAVVVSGSLAWSADKSQFAVVKNGDIFNLIYEGPRKMTVSVEITDEAGNKIFSEKIIANEGFIRPYNLSQLPKGAYALSVRDETAEHTEVLDHRDKKWIVHVARLQTSEPKVMVAVPNQGLSELVIEFYDTYQNLVYSESENVNEGFARVYHLVDLDGVTIYVRNKTTGEVVSYTTD